ncbi:multi-sensor signal transduction histidine kinase [Rhodopseudomonas thermotolerans]|uniref:histidine kinase n=2 Tax=Rhodopseudomonas TaxID=1073 RepID=A0A336JNQ6_9BRAD|nr:MULTISPECIES: CHASE3 domain-containing protein [Rhodopseudomonas]RED33299.1 multi-sensor signal transduction histidine kinase [Rhodopseudomonas pentothenatexigens]REF94048.1 multi-sensor signal transduction histidine kinase [Rhodopseudomonas thermotolerans]SSW91375.1 multi-sensor signal transduction histidine kinase [Rhodopseudomonas pentothenatexigens]
MSRKSLSTGVLGPWLLGATLLLFIVIAGALVLNLMRLRDSFSWVQQTNEALLALSGIQQAVLEAETSERGYLLTGVETYRDSYSRAREALATRLDSLRAVLADNPEQIAHIDELRLLTDMRMAQLGRVVELGPERMREALDILEQARVDRLTERIETSLTTLTRAEQALLIQRLSRHDRESLAAALITACLLILAVGSAAIAAFLIEHQRAVARQQEADQRLQALQAELLRVARLSTMGEMSSALAHELNQPLAAVTNYVQGSRRLIEASSHPDKGKISTALDKAAQQTLRAGAVIQRLREFVGRGETDKTIESLRAIAEDALALASVLTRDRPVDVALALDPAIDRVLVDKVQVQQVFLNLIRNAFEAMWEQRDRRLTIGSRLVEDDMVEVVVADTGPGLDSLIAERIFQPFATTKADGMGVGLSISQTIIQAHGGSIRAEPSPGGGTLFRFTLPCADPPRQQAIFSPYAAE